MARHVLAAIVSIIACGLVHRLVPAGGVPCVSGGMNVVKAVARSTL